MRIPSAHSLAGFFSARQRMRADWDLRARRDARYFIDCGHGATDGDFWKSGEEDLRDSVLRGVEIDRACRALEIGCGIGRLLRPLSDRVDTAIGVDISGEMIRRGREALADRPSVRFEVTDGNLSWVPDASLDLVYSHIVFQHVPTKKAVSRYFAESARVLKGAGVLRFQADGRAGRLRLPPGTWHGVAYRAAAIRAELDALGFEVVDLTGEGTQYMWTTALRRSETGRPATTAARARPRAWNPEALDRLLERLGRGAAERERVVDGTVRVRDLARAFLAKRRAASPREHVATVYRALLGREADEAGLAHYAGEIERGARRSHVIDCLLASAEFDAQHRSAPTD